MWYFLNKEKLSPVRFIVFSQGRSGSAALESLLNSLPNMLCEEEILRKPVPLPYVHVLAKCAYSRADIYGCKILTSHVKWVQNLADRENFIRLLYKRDFKIIYLKRENLVLKALSNIRARVYGFHKKKFEQFTPEKLTVDLNELLRWIREGDSLNQYENLLLQDIPHLPLIYEQHLADEAQHQSTVDLVCKFLGIESTTVECSLRKVSPKALRDSVANYDDLVGCLRDTPYAKYLDIAE